MVFGYRDPKGGSLRTKNQERGPEQRNRFGPSKATRMKIDNSGTITQTQDCLV